VSAVDPGRGADVEEILRILPQHRELLSGSPDREIQETLDRVVNLEIDSLAVQICDGCNMLCTYCYLTKDSGVPKYRPLDRALFDPLVAFIDEHSRQAERFTLELYGGEPLMAFRELRALIETQRRRFQRRDTELFYKVYTNGTIWSREIEEFLGSVPNLYLQVSIDGDRGVHDSTRPMVNGSGSFDRVLENARRFMDLLPGRVFASATVDGRADGSERIGDTLAFLREVGFEQVSLNFSVGVQATGAGVDPAFEERLHAEIDALADAYVSSALRWDPLPWQEMSSLVHQLHVARPTVQGFMCGKFNRGCWLTLGADGAFYPDLFLIGVPRFRLGDVRDGIDRDRLARIMRGLMLDRIPECADCWARHLCGGALHIKQVTASDAIQHNESRCNVYRHVARRAVEIYARLDRVNPALHSGIQRSALRKRMGRMLLERLADGSR
jgi:uncharacterized protein